MGPEDRQLEDDPPQPPRWLIATFSPITKWDGRTITYDGAAFTLEGDGRLDPRTVQAYGRQGFLLWASPDAFALVEQAAGRPEIAAAPADTAADVELQRPGGRRRRSVAAALGIVALVVAVALVAGVFRLQTSSTGGTDSRPASTAGPHATRQPAVRVSTNWAGYVATGGRFTSVEATWQQPEGSASESRHFSIWVGLDGDGETVCEQIGTLAWTDTGLAFYELLPSAAVDGLSLSGPPGAESSLETAIRPGDSITASVTCTGGRRFVLRLSDNTRHLSFATTQTAPAATCASAEIILETHYAGGHGPATFDTVGFTHCLVNGRPLSSWPLTRAVTSSPPGARPSAILFDGETFLVTHR